MPRAKTKRMLVGMGCTKVYKASVLTCRNKVAGQAGPSIVLNRRFSKAICRTKMSSDFRGKSEMAIRPVASYNRYSDYREKSCGLYAVGFGLVNVSDSKTFTRCVGIPRSGICQLKSAVSVRRKTLVRPLTIYIRTIRGKGVTTNRAMLIINNNPVKVVATLATRREKTGMLVSRVDPCQVRITGRLKFRMLGPARRSFLRRVGRVARKQNISISVRTANAGGKVITYVRTTHAGKVIIVANLPGGGTSFSICHVVTGRLRLIKAEICVGRSCSRTVRLLSSKKLSLDDLVDGMIPLRRTVRRKFRTVSDNRSIVGVLVSLSSRSRGT